MELVEHNSVAPLTHVLDRIEPDDQDWGFAAVKRAYLQAMTNEACSFALRPIFESVDEAHIAYGSDDTIYIAWNGQQKQTYSLLSNFVRTTLLRTGVSVDPGVLISYLDHAQRRSAIRNVMQGEDVSDLEVTAEQGALFQTVCSQKWARKALQLLIVEDLLFSQRFLCEILRDARMRVGGAQPVIDMAQGVGDAWKLFLAQAPDIVFVDLNLADGSGHRLARAIKRLDISTRVVIVTANPCGEELSVARGNQVDDFITKPYNKKRILEGIQRMMNANASTKALRSGSGR